MCVHKMPLIKSSARHLKVKHTGVLKLPSTFKHVTSFLKLMPSLELIWSVWLNQEILYTLLSPLIFSDYARKDQLPT